MEISDYRLLPYHVNLYPKRHSVSDNNYIWKHFSRLLYALIVILLGMYRFIPTLDTVAE